MKSYFFIMLFALTGLNAAVSQTTLHGIDSHWYPSSRTAASITGPLSPVNNVGGAVANNMVVKTDGTVIIFYRQGGQNKWIQSADNGNTWTSPGTLYPPAASGLSTITADIDQSNNIYIAWKSGNFSIGFAKYNGSTWTANTINTTTQTAADTVGFIQISLDRKNRIHLMWQQGNHKNYTSGIKSTCWYARSTDGGTTFSTAQLSNNTTNNYHAAFPVADFGGTGHDTLMIAWRENVNGCSGPMPSACASNGWNWDVKARTTYDGGATWNPVFTLEGSGASNDTDHDQWDPNIVVDKNGVIHAFYHIYHNTAIPDYNAKIMYEYSLDGGNTWSTPAQLSTSGIRSHLVKTAYDYTNNYVWCTWKDEMDFGSLPSGNPQADLKAVYIQNTGTPVISAQEFITDEDTSEVAFHNFKVGNDGIMRATYNISKLQGKGDSILYTQRSTLSTGIYTQNTSVSEMVKVYPNPTNDAVYLSFTGQYQNTVSIKVYNAQGILINAYSEVPNRMQLPCSGLYFIEVIQGNNRQLLKIIRY